MDIHSAGYIYRPPPPSLPIPIPFSVAANATRDTLSASISGLSPRQQNLDLFAVLQSNGAAYVLNKEDYGHWSEVRGLSYHLVDQMLRSPEMLVARGEHQISETEKTSRAIVTFQRLLETTANGVDRSLAVEAAKKLLDYILLLRLYHLPNDKRGRLQQTLPELSVWFSDAYTFLRSNELSRKPSTPPKHVRVAAETVNGDSPQLERSENYLERAVDALRVQTKATSLFSVIGNTEAKEALQQAFIAQKHFSHLSGYDAQCNAVLLHGPPGSGKTMLCNWAAEEEGWAYYNVDVADVMSKFVGDPEKFVKILAATALETAPSIIFLDEVDALFGSRCGEQGAESSLRVKTAFLTAMSTLASSPEHIMVLATTNRPWALDTAFLRRFEMRILVDLPAEAELRSIIAARLANVYHCVTREQLDGLASKFLGMSGADVKTGMAQLGRVLMQRAMKSEYWVQVEYEGNKHWAACGQSEPGCKKFSISVIAAPLPAILTAQAIHAVFTGRSMTGNGSIRDSNIRWSEDHGTRVEVGAAGEDYDAVAATWT